MSRDQFTAEFARGMRYILQKHDRAMAARPYAATAYEEAQTNLDGAIQQLADHLFDSLEAIKQEAIEA
ncbi:MAG: hypothetical protein V4529_16755 [Gemmatimonadota bacterium]